MIKRTPVHYLYNIRLDFTFGYNSEYRERYSIPIYVYKEDVWEYYNSIAKASRCLNIQETHIVRCLKGKGSTNKGYYFFYKKPSDLSFTNARRGGKKVSINGKIFNSIKEASLHLNMLERSLRKAIQQQTRFIVDNNIKYIY